MTRKTLDKVIRDELTRRKNQNKDSQIIKSIRRRKNSATYNHDNSKVIEKLKQEYKDKQLPLIDVSEVSNDYNLLINDESVLNPFIISSGLVKIIRKHTQPYLKKDKKARAIYDWMENNIFYGQKKRKNGYKNSEEVVLDKEGVCGEMAFVYITMARCCGLKSAYVHVERDYIGKKVNHACAIVDVGYKDILVDPAYHTFDVQHRKYFVWTDSEVLEKFNHWRLN